MITFNQYWVIAIGGLAVCEARMFLAELCYDGRGWGLIGKERQIHDHSCTKHSPGPCVEILSLKTQITWEDNDVLHTVEMFLQEH